MSLRLDPGARAVALLARRSSQQAIWIVGGYLRNLALGRPSDDLDLACFDAHDLAQRMAGPLRAKIVVLDETNHVYRLILPPRKFAQLKQVDISAVQGKSIEEDLARRDFTINALAFEVTAPAIARRDISGLVDPRGGLTDIKKRLVRGEIEKNFIEDPLRLLRAYRFCAQLDLSLDHRTETLIRRHRALAQDPAPERTTAELMILLGATNAAHWLRRMDESRLLTALIPELEPARRCAQSYYGRGGVMRHTLDVCARLDYLLDNIARIYPKLSPELTAHIAERGGNGYRALLMLAALLHDVAKPETAKMMGGRLRFFEHDFRGAKRTEEILRRLRFSNERITTAAAIVRHHLRPGHLATAQTITDRAAYRFFRDLGDDAPGLLLVCWADHASYMTLPGLKSLLKIVSAKSGKSVSRVSPNSAQKTVFHLRIVTELLRRWTSLRQSPTAPRLVDGKDVMKVLGIRPGPSVGEWIERIREAQAEGIVKDRDAALAFMRRTRI